MNLPQKYSHLLSASTLFKLVVFIVFSVFSYHLFTLLKYAVDIPYLDDWRPILNGTADQLSMDILFSSANDTMYTTGVFLDYLNIKLLAGNNILYQTISFVIVMGSLLLLQYRLLKELIPSEQTLAFSVIFLIFMLQGSTYWGQQSIAYHQALPLISVLSILLITIRKPNLNGWLVSLMVFSIGVAGGLAYISGAIALLAMLATFIFGILFIDKTKLKEYKFPFIGVFLATLVTLPIQLWVILITQKGGTHVPNSAWALPYEADFWAYLIGKFARAIGLYNTQSVLAVSVSIVAFISIIASISYLLWKLAFKHRKHTTDNDVNLYLVYVSLSAIVFAYLFMVSAGRANLREESLDTILEVFWLGQFRFHYFWITLLFPWFALIISTTLLRNLSERVKNIVNISTVFLVVLYFIGVGGLKDIRHHYKSTGDIKMKGVECIANSLLKGENVYCPTIYPVADLTTALMTSNQLGLTFTSTFNEIFSIPAKSAEVFTPLFKLSSSSISKLSVENMAHNVPGYPLIVKSTTSDPQIVFNLPELKLSLENCNKLKFRFDVTTNQADMAQLFYLPNGGDGYFNENDSLTASYAAKPDAVIEYEVLRKSGFQPMFRLDPGVTPGQEYQISNIEILCH